MTRCPSVVAVILLAVSTITPALGGLLSDATLTRDTETGREWLDLSFTVGRQFWSVENDPTLGGTVSGFHPASAAELETLMNSVGVSLGLSSVPSAYTSVDTILTFVGTLFVEPFGLWKESFIVVTDSPPFQPDRRVVFQIRAQEASPVGFPATGTTQETTSVGILGSSSTRAMILVRSAPNGTPATAISPASTDPITGALSFLGTGNGAWFNAGGQAGPDLQINTLDGSKITHVSLPKALADPGDLFTVFDPLLGEVQVPFGEVHVLSEAVDALRLGGLQAPVSAISSTLAAALNTGPLADPFPIFLKFDNPNVNFFVTSVGIPEPAAAPMLCLSVVIVCRLRRMIGRR